MTPSDIVLLKANIDQLVIIHTRAGEHIAAKVIFVMDNEDYDEHNVIYEAQPPATDDVGTQQLKTWYTKFEDIIAVTPCKIDAHSKQLSLIPNP